MDSEEQIFGPVNELHEVAAQAFAADFLMPLAVVNRALDRLALPQGLHAWTAPETYQMALELGVSYRAMLTQLSALNLISKSALGELRKVPPSEIKKSLNSGQAPANTRADVWIVRERTRHRHMRLQVDDELRIQLPAPPASPPSGCSWHGSDDALVSFDQDNDQRAQPTLDLTDASEEQCLLWRAKKVGRGVLRVESGNAWIGQDAPSVPFEINVEVIERGNADGQHVRQRQRALEHAAREFREALGKHSGARWDNDL